MAKKVIISGGGTGGHVFPAIAIAHAIKRLAPDTDILFVGAEGRMEMDKVPAAGYPIRGLDIQGINRQSPLQNLVLPFKLLKSVRTSRAIIRDFKPDAVVGVGGYASGPLLLAARFVGIPYLIQEQNSYAGLTNRKLGTAAAKICVAFQGMERFFPASRILVTGNPIRPEAVAIAGKREEALRFFDLDPAKKTLLVTGGSLGARTLNECIKEGLEEFADAQVQIIWQCGSYYFELLQGLAAANVRIFPFIQRMDLAYAAADLIVSRAGAGTLSELYVVGKPVVLVPSPNVAEDHQSKNAEALVSQQAARAVPDAEAPERLVRLALEVLADEKAQQTLARNIVRLALPDADEVIAREVLKLTESSNAAVK